MTKLQFSCSSCARCCHGLRLVLDAKEAIEWAQRGNLVQILCHATADISKGGEVADYKRNRRILARSGDLPIRVQLILAARFEGACPNLQADMGCGIYGERPNVCRIYPAEIVPGTPISAADRLCPPEAWDATQPDFLAKDGAVVDPVTHDAIEETRKTGLSDVFTKEILAKSLGINVAALENEGYVVWTFPPDKLASALADAIGRVKTVNVDVETREWHFYSLRAETINLIRSIGARVVSVAHFPTVDYLPLY